MARRTDPDRLAELEEERRFLLRSLADLEREHAAGDVDDDDYRELRDGYTVRAAATLREIEAGRSALPAKPPVNWRRRIAVGVATLGLIAIVWTVLAATSAQRLGDQTITGDDQRTPEELLLAEARSLLATDPAAAAERYTEVLAAEPDHAEALAYRGWTRWLTADSTQAAIDAIADLNRAIEAEPTYPDPYCFRGIVMSRLGETAGAVDDLEQCLAHNPPADVRGLVEGLLASLTAPAGSVPATDPDATP